MARNIRVTVGIATAATLLCLSANAFANEPVALTDGQLDQVTAGLSLGVGTAALATGNFTLTSVGAEADGNTTRFGGATTQTGVAAGTASAVAPGGSTATGVDTEGSVSGNTGFGTGFHGTVGGAGGQISIGFTYVTGSASLRP